MPTISRKPSAQVTAKPAGDMPPIAGGASQAEPRPEIVPAPPFLLLHHPRKWHVMEGLVVPILTKLVLKSGSNGVYIERNGAYNISLAIADKRSKGWTELPANVDGNSYLKKDGMGGWITRWEEVHPGLDYTVTDSQEYALWCRMLVDDGIIPEPHISVILRLRDHHQSQIMYYAKIKDQGRVDMHGKLADICTEYIDRKAKESQPLESTEAIPEFNAELADPVPEPKGKK